MRASAPALIWRLYERYEPRFSRIISIVSSLLLFLPFVSVKGCGKEASIAYSGWELFLQHGGWVYGLMLAAALVYAADSFQGGKRGRLAGGFAAACKAVLASLSGAVALIYPELQFILDSVSARAGQIGLACCWCIAFSVQATGVGAALELERKRRRDGVRPRPQVHAPWRGMLAFSAASSCLLCLAAPLAEFSHRGIIALAIIALFYSAPSCAAVYFLYEGLYAGDRWARIWTPVQSLSQLAVVGFLVIRFISGS